MFRAKNQSKKSDDVKKSAGKVLDIKRDTATRVKHLQVFLDNSEIGEILQFFDSYYSHIFSIIYDSFITSEQSLQQKGVHKTQREELESVLYLLEKVLVYLPEALSQRWQYHSIGRLMSKLLHPGNSWKLLKREAMRLFLLWYSSLGEQAGDQVHAIFATLVPGFPSPYPNMGLTALAALTPEPSDGPVSPAPILPLIPPQSAERLKSQDTDLIRIFLEVLLELMVSQVILVEWREDKGIKQKRAFNFLFEKFKTFYMPTIFSEFNWHMSLFKPSLELPEVRKFRPSFIDTGDGTKKMDPMLACRVVVINWIAQYTHVTQRGQDPLKNNQYNSTAVLNFSRSHPAISDKEQLCNPMSSNISDHPLKNSLEGQLVREVLYGTRHNINFVHEVYRQSFLLSFSHSPAMKKVITVYKDWIQMNVQELPPFLLEQNYLDINEEGYLKSDDVDGPQQNKIGGGDYYFSGVPRDQMTVRAGLQNVLQIFVTNAANVFLLEVSPEYPILLEEQVEMCKRVLNIYRYMVMNVKMDGRTWEQLLFILLQITQLTLTETPPRRREDSLGGRLSQAIFQTLIVTWIKANLYVIVSCELWDQFLEVLSSLTLWEELIREWFKTMETLTRVLARQVYNLDLNDLPLDRLTEQKAKKQRGKTGGMTQKISVISSGHGGTEQTDGRYNGHPSFRQGGVPESPYPGRARKFSSSNNSNNLVSYTQCSNDARMSRAMRQRSMSEGAVDLHREIDPIFAEASICRERLVRCQSVDSLRQMGRYRINQEGTFPSPAPSNSMESHSIKDSPIQLDHDTVSEGAYSDLVEQSSEREEPRSVMAGGSVKGWLPDVAVMLWRRMLGALGDINTIADTVIHAQIYKYLIELNDIMVKIRTNQGVSLDNTATPQPPDFVPPFTIFAPWCFRALALPDTYQRGRMYALRLLCLITVRQQDNRLSRTHLTQFYKVLHRGLTSEDSDTVHTLIRFTGSRFFSLSLPGYSSFLLDYLAAANMIVSNQDLKGVPRTEAVSITGSLLAFPTVVATIPLLLPIQDKLSMVSSHELQDQVIGILLKAGKKEPAGLARCIALSSLGVFVYRELVHETYHPKLKDAITVLVTALRFNNKAVAQVASDMLLLLSDQVNKLLVYHADIPRKIVEVLSRSLSSLLPQPSRDISLTTEDRRLLLSLLNCLGEWCMKLPLLALTHIQEDSQSLLHKVFSALLTGVRSAPNSPACSMLSTIGPMDGIDPVQLAARTVLRHLVNHLHHFPQAIGASSLSCQVFEHDDVPSITTNEITIDTFMAPNIQMFVLSNTTLLSLIEIPFMDQPDETCRFTSASNEVRVIFRDISGKFSWEASIIQSKNGATDSQKSPTWEGVSKQLLSTVLSPTRHTTRRRPPSDLPTHAEVATDLDQLDDLLQYLGHTSNEVLSIPGYPLNAVSPWPGQAKLMEGDVITSLINQRNMEVDHCARIRPSACATKQPKSTNNSYDSHQSFQQARTLFQQLGLSSWEKRPHINLIDKNEQLLRELKNLDQQKGRETHKIAVIYVAEGQEDKLSILSNTGGSQDFEEFVAGLGWEVELETHTGFMGGLTRNRSTGETAPYYATSFTEVMFHASTRMSSNSEESMLQKTRHLGNDEIHIVWTEHTREYRRGILPTEFCDALIVIYPLKNKLYRIQVIRKPEVPFFGPLYNEMIVDHAVLPGLVRATAINASRAKRAMMSYYQTYYEERAKSLDNLIEKFKQQSTYEDFVANVYSPCQLGTLTEGSIRSSETSTTSMSNSYTKKTDVTAALLDPSPGPPGGWVSAEYEHRPRAQTDNELRNRQIVTDRSNDTFVSHYVTNTSHSTTNLMHQTNSTAHSSHPMGQTSYSETQTFSQQPSHGNHQITKTSHLIICPSHTENQANQPIGHVSQPVGPAGQMNQTRTGETIMHPPLRTRVKISGSGMHHIRGSHPDQS